jgi:hypothetical protein
MLTIFFIIIVLLVTAGIFSGLKTFARYVAIAFDMFVNVLTAGSLDVTISSRAGVAAEQGKLWGRVLSRFLDLLEKDHCQLAIQSDIDRAKQTIVTLTPYDNRNK